ncbi:FAD-binding protein [Synechococcales cyanobacterium C]|uniref:FAD-binding protein n=1 Tax=Petrachloros mirabilis ULC683 TaxID=2781853 RepID=A0A8K2A878_9CYAN|nr:FAD-binding protein [Petrachloros mirabilis ULC683]
MTSLSSPIVSILSDALKRDGALSANDLTISQKQSLAQVCNDQGADFPWICPLTQDELATVIRCAHQHHWRLLICGQGSKLHWGGLSAGVDLGVSTARLNRIIDHAVGDLTVTVEAGIGFRDLQTQLAASGQWLALDPAYADQATVGGIVATRNAGSLRHRYGGLRDMCLGVSFVRADGQVAKAGGRVVKNVAGYDLMKLLTGSYGTLGVMSQLTLRLYPLPEDSSTVLLGGTPVAIGQLRQALLSSSLTPTAVDIVTPSLLASGEVTAELALMVRFQGLAASVQVQCDRILSLAQSVGVIALTPIAPDQPFWDALCARLWPPSPPADTVACQFGVPAQAAVQVLGQIQQQCQQQGVACWGQLHAGSGLGTLRLRAISGVQADLIHTLRSQAQQALGFLTLLEAPSALKSAVDVWGYTGNALPLMGQLKSQFDPQAILNPGRFVGGL